MATFNITVPDAVVSRIQAAFSIDGVTPATQAIVLQAVKDFIKARVQQVEADKSFQATLVSVSKEIW